MRRIQKVTAVVSVIVILVLGIGLGAFIWKEKQENSALSKEGVETQQEEVSEGNQEQENVTGLEEEQEWSNEEQETQQKIEQEEPEITDVTMLFTGDVMLEQAVRSNYDNSGITGILSEYLLQEMNQADITVINEEFPFSDRGTPAPDKQYTFRIAPDYVSAFGDMGVDVVSLANNHALDYGTEALLDTFAVLGEAGIPYVGAGDSRERAEEAVILECGGRTVGVLSASRVIPVVSWNIENQQPGLFCTYDSSALAAAIEETRKRCDYVVVYVHWGVERQNYPEEYQRTLAQNYIDAGADLVVGSHPHVPQGIEYYKGKPIVYSLGNFIFYANTTSTYVLKVVWDAAGESHLQVIPVAASDALTSELEGQEAADMRAYIEEISYDIQIDENGMVLPK